VVPVGHPGSHSYFGRLRYNEDLSWWEARPPRHPRIRIFLAHDDTALLVHAESVCRHLEAWRERAESLACRQILTREVKGPLTDLDLALKSVSFHEGSHMLFFFQGGEPFGGRSVEVAGSIHEGLRQARITG
jgi:hypothetical protein